MATVSNSSLVIFNGKLDQQQIGVWSDYPITLAPLEKPAYCPQTALGLLQGRIKQPSKMAGISTTNSDVILSVDKLFREKVRQYGDLLIDATRQDLQNIRDTLSKRQNTTGKSAVGGVGAGAAIGGLFFSLPGAAAGGLIGLIVGGGGAKVYVNCEVSAKSSYHRKAWLAKIASLEQDRIDASTKALVAAAAGLARSIKEIRQEGEQALIKEQELQQIADVYKAISGSDLLIESQTVLQLLTDSASSEVVDG